MKDLAFLFELPGNHSGGTHIYLQDLLREDCKSSTASKSSSAGAALL